MIWTIKVFWVFVVIVEVKSRPNSDIRILTYNNILKKDGYEFNFETNDDIVRHENGNYKPTSPDEGIMTVMGHFSHIAPEGAQVTVTFVADENGYRPIVSISYFSGAGGGVPEAGGGFGGEHVNSISGAAIASLAGGGLGRR